MARKKFGEILVRDAEKLKLKVSSLGPRFFFFLYGTCMLRGVYFMCIHLFFPGQCEHTYCKLCMQLFYFDTRWIFCMQCMHT
jgi:hypothetical protein